MSSFSTSSFPTSKRSACDRCRAQKLRCPARDGLSEACGRCRRAGAQCVISYTQPLGQQRAAARSDRPAPPTRAPLPTPDPGPLSTSSYLSEATSGTGGGSNDSTSPRYWEWVPPDVPPSQDAVLQLSTPDGSLDILGNLFHHDNNILSYELLFPGDGMDLELESDPDASRAPHHANLSDTCDPAPDNLLPRAEPECDPRLAELNHELSRHLQTWTHSGAVAGGSGSSSRRQSTSQLVDLFGDNEDLKNPYGNTLRLMSEFLAILRCYKSRPTTIITLNLVTAYLQLVAICNYVLGHLRRQLLLPESSSTTTAQARRSFGETSLNSEFQPLPGLQLAGFVVQEAGFQTKILIQAILHYFDAYEKTLGLAPDVCISGNTETMAHSGGLFCDRQDQNLIKHLMMNTGVESAAGLGALSSLRDNIRQLRQLVRS